MALSLMLAWALSFAPMCTQQILLLCRSPDKNKVAMAFSMLHGVVSALRDWTQVPGVVPTVIFCFEQAVHAMLPGQIQQHWEC